MSIQLLISTMHRTDASLLEKMKICSDAVVINQCDKEDRRVFTHDGHEILWIDTTERGLSKSRNMAIRNATAEVCMLADDDMEYHRDYVDTVTSAFARTGADVIGFQVRGIEKKFKDYSPRERRITYLRSMKMASVELAFRRSAFVTKGVTFDELIGAGTELMMGEENAVLFQCIRKGLAVFYVPAEIADLHVGASTWFTERNQKFFIGKGAAFAAMKTPFTTLLIWQWAIRKRGLYGDRFSVSEVIGMMQDGKRIYLTRSKG